MAKKAPIDACKLCQRTAALKESHIISKLFWKGSGLFRELKYFEAETIKGNGPTLRNQQDGFKEYLLCSDCELRFSKWETYGNKVFFGSHSPFITTPIAERIFLPRIDYTPFKLLIMSILWRMALTTHPFYERVRLPPHNLEELRVMFLAGNPGEPHEYPCSFSVLVNATGILLPGLFSPAAQILLPTYPDPLFGIIIAGVNWLFFVSQNAPQFLSPCFIQKNGEIWLRVTTPDNFKWL